MRRGVGAGDHTGPQGTPTKVLSNSTKLCYTYDSLNRVTQKTAKKLADGSVVSSEAFSYDAAGNITGATDGSGCSASCYVTVSYLVDQLTGVQTFSYQEDGKKHLSKNFKVSEFQCKDGTDEILIDMKLVEYLQAIRDWAGASITITSGYRTPTHHAKPEVRGAPDSRHLYGRAADIVCSGKSPLQLAQQAEAIGVQGIEWNPVKNYTHIDTRTETWHVRYTLKENEEVDYIPIKSFAALG